MFLAARPVYHSEIFHANSSVTKAVKFLMRHSIVVNTDTVTGISYGARRTITPLFKEKEDRRYLHFLDKRISPQVLCKQLHNILRQKHKFLGGERNK